jgi:hypothetical protein
MAETRAEAQDLIGRKIIDPHGDKIGTIEALLIHGDEERANWARIKLGAFGIHSAFVPLHEAQDEDGDVRIVYEREYVKAAPEIEPDGDRIGDEDADVLHRHYGMERVVGLTKQDADDDIELSRETRDAKPPAMDQGAFPKPPIPGVPEDQQPSPIKDPDD